MEPYGNGTRYLEYRCPPLPWLCGSYSDLGDYGGLEVGTSMAAPAVAGIAALVLSAHPSFDASRVAGCITGNAGAGELSLTWVVSRSPLTLAANRIPEVDCAGQLPIVDAQAAVECSPL